jgi:hypothetical protein
MTLGPVAVALATVAAIHEIPGFGPWIADTGRAVLGDAAVAHIEDAVYGVEDDFAQVLHRNAKPTTYWSQTQAQRERAAVPRGAGFRPADFAPPFRSVAADGDGQWVPMQDADAPTAAPLAYEALVHPDPKRPYAAVVVVAIDLSRARLHMVAGTAEPASRLVDPQDRPGVVAAEDRAQLAFAFNGGFKAEHGHYGMMVDRRVILPARDGACTVAETDGGGLRIGTWAALAPAAPQMASFRQTPPCLVEGGAISSALDNDGATGWGASVSGATIIRRSALGLDASRKTLFYAFGDSVSAGSLARAIRSAGAVDAAQLDVNQAFPRFVSYAHAAAGAPPRVTRPIVPGLRYTPDEYVGKPEERDFFYVTRSSGRSVS